MKKLAQYNRFLEAMHQIQNDFYLSAGKELTGKIVKFTDEYIQKNPSHINNIAFAVDCGHINPNTRMRIVEIIRYSSTLWAEVEYLNCDCYIDTELQLDVLVLVDEGE